MFTWQALVTIFGVHLLVTMTPGPNMLLVSRTAAVAGRKNGFAVIAGFCASGAIWVTTSALGVKALFRMSPLIHDVVAGAGALYLIWLGLKLLRAKRHGVDLIANPESPHREALGASFSKGFISNITNPKTLVYFTSVFGAILPKDPNAMTIMALILITWLCNHIWYGSLTLLLSGKTARAAYRNAGSWLDRVAGSLMVLFGIRLLASRSQQW